MLDSNFRPKISETIWERFPDYRALSVLVLDFEPTQKLVAPPIQLAGWCEEHIDAWREAYKKFGAVPKKTPSSLESLFKRYTKEGELPAISDMVDSYNALSLCWGAPFGGEDILKYSGMPRLVIADGHETFDTVREGVAVIETAEVGEVVWKDDVGVTCRRWNWRQCRRTAVTGETRNLWFVIDRLNPMPIDSLKLAGEALASLLQNASPNSSVKVDLLAP
jgi:DNA/RNA-binding domain of Phe-tRNA-synthetase-like protein